MYNTEYSFFMHTKKASAKVPTAFLQILPRESLRLSVYGCVDAALAPKYNSEYSDCITLRLSIT